MPLSPEQSKTASANVAVRRARSEKIGTTRGSGQPKSSERRPDFHPFSREVANTASEMLNEGMRFHERKLNSRLLEQLRTEFTAWIQGREEEFNRQLKAAPKQYRKQWLHENSEKDSRRLRSRANRLLCEFIPAFIELRLEELEQLKSDNREFRRVVSRVETESEIHHVIIDYAVQLGATNADLKKDKKALHLWLDEEAMNDRFLKIAGEKELLIVFALDRLGETISQSFELARQWQEDSNELG